MNAAPSRARRAVLRLFGERPSVLFLLVSPTILAVLLDVALRAPSLARFPPIEWLNYFGSTLAAAGFVGGPLWLVSRLFLPREGRARVAARALRWAFFLGVFLPFAFFAYGAQTLYYRVFQAYIGRDTVRFGIRLRGTVAAWLASWGAGVVFMIVVGLVVTAIVATLVRRAAAPLARSWPILPALGFSIASYCFWIDFVESRALQAAPPDTCFLHGVVRALKVALTQRGAPLKGVSLRIPDPLPALTPPARRPDVIVILSESVRADDLCSDRRDGCAAPFLDEIAPDRAALGVLTSQASGTFIACMMLWTGLPPTADFETAHRAPMLWEIAGAVGYRTAYITSQNLRYADLGAYVQRAGIDVKVSAADLGDASDAHIGAPDELATGRTLAFIRDVPEGTPYFAVVHLSNTHWPYRVDPDLQPYAPHDPSPLAWIEAMHNHYRNSVRQQERTVAAFLRELERSPRWDDTAVIFLSDHGEEFREHRKLYHLHNVFDEEVRVPGWLLAGRRAVTDAQRAALGTFAGQRTYSQDVQATVIDLLGVFDQRGALPFASMVTGRSLLRPRPSVEPTVAISTTSGVWEADDPVYGVRCGELLLVGYDTRPFACFDSRADPWHQSPLPVEACGSLLEDGRRLYPDVPAQ